MKKIPFFISVPLLVVFIFLLSVQEGNTIPAFGRKYRISCQTCHAPVMPALKDFGDEFAGNGFRLADYESPRYYVETGDEKLSLIREFPLAVRFDGHVSYNNINRGTPDFGTPFGLKLMSGGELSKKLSYYFYFFMNEKGEVTGLEDAFLMYHDVFGTGINLYIGQFQVCDPLFKRELRLTLEDYHIYTVTPGNSNISLKYDRGILLEYGLPTGTDLVAEIVNGNGINRAGEGYLFDKDKYKNYLLRISQSVGDNISIGFFGYFGKEELPQTGGPVVNNARLFGPDISFSVENFALNVQYLRRTDSKLIAIPDVLQVDDVLTHGGFAELIFSPRGDMSNWYLAGLANWMESDFRDLNYKTATIHAGYLLRRNVRLVSEYTRYFSGDKFGKASIGFVSAF